MFSFFLPKAVKQGRQFAQDARKMVAYKRDLWNDRTREEFQSGIISLEKASASRDTAAIEDAARHLDKLCHQHLPKVADAGWRENVEVFLVAIVVALAVRTFFLQPFTIPTGSMQPTLNGILGFPTKEEPPGMLTRLAHTAFYGRTWIDTVALDDEVVSEMDEVSRFRFFTYTKVQTSKVEIQSDGSERLGVGSNTYFIHAPLRTLTEMFDVSSRKTYRKGEPIARGYINTGDHVFVDKISYHFRKPQIGDVFVFNTQNISGGNMGNPGPPPRKPSQFYIKRLVGTPLDELRVDPPQLFVNGKVVQGYGVGRVMSGKDGYRGYTNAAEMVRNGLIGYQGMTYLNHPKATFNVPEKHYFAMGDNSYHSSDSRDWGSVPQENLMGRGVFVYWPFGPHWGFIR